MGKRKYVKKSDYWDKFSKDSSEDLSKIIQSNNKDFKDIQKIGKLRKK